MESSVSHKSSSIIVGKDGMSCGNCTVVNLLPSQVEEIEDMQEVGGKYNEEDFEI